MIYFISDPHLSHANIIWMSKRPFNDVEEMDHTIINNWNSIVKETDTVYLLGDFAYRCHRSKIKKYLEELKGKIILIKGNHDGQVLKVNQQIHRFESVHDYLVLEYEKYKFILFHYPIESWWHKSRGAFHLHGHIHEHQSILPHPRKFNVSVENIEYKPISIVEVLNKLNNNEGQTIN
jgi:calcineurin-like phosphoesterase family protein